MIPFFIFGGFMKEFLSKLKKKLTSISDRILDWIFDHSRIMSVIVTAISVVAVLLILGWGVGSCTNAVRRSAVVGSYRLISKAEMGDGCYALTLENIHTFERRDFVMSGYYSYMFEESDNVDTSAYRIRNRASRALLFKELKERAEYEVKWLSEDHREIISIDPELPTKTPSECRQ
jgi:hypothetical protein